MTRMQASFLMMLVILSRSISYLFSKNLLTEIEPFCLLALRFGCAFVILAVLFRSHLRAASVSELVRGAALGAILAGLMFCEMKSLETTDTTVVSFVENTAVVLVPLASAVLFRTKIRAPFMCCTFISLVGVFLLTACGTNAAPSRGVLFAAIAALLYTLFIVLTTRFSQNCDPIVLGVMQMGSAFVLCLIAALFLGTLTLPQSANGWGCLAVLVLVCSVFGFTFQPVAQKYISEVQAAMTCAMNPVCASIAGVLALGEQLSVFGWCGAGLVLVALIVSTLLSNADSSSGV